MCVCVCLRAKCREMCNFSYAKSQKTIHYNETYVVHACMLRICTYEELYVHVSESAHGVLPSTPKL